MEWWQYIIGGIAFVLILGLIVLIHEGGHFLMARKAGILCYEFAIGMGPVLFQFKKGETVYSIRLIPIGGFVSMAGEEVEFDALKGVKEVKLRFNELNQVVDIIADIDNVKYDGMSVYSLISHDIVGTKEAKDDELFLEVKNNDTEETTKFVVNRTATLYFPKKQMLQIAPYNRNFTNKTVLQRFLAVAAGPLMNFVLAIVLFAILGIFQGYANTESTKISAPDTNAPIYAADNSISKSDEIISIEGFEVTGEWANISNLFALISNPETTSINNIPYVYDGLIDVTYKDAETGELKSIKVVPNTYIYSAELVFQNEGFDIAGKYLLPYVGSYGTSNNKTKAYKAGLREGDLITGVKLEGEESFTPVLTKMDLIKYFANKDDSMKVVFEYTRYDEKDPLNIQTKQETKVLETYSKKLLEASNVTSIKLELGITPVYEFNFVKFLYRPWVDMGTCVYNIFRTLGLLFNRSANVHLDDFSGPIGIFELISTSASQGILQVIYITAFLSVNIGFVNILPLPALDGGRLAFIIYEAITKHRPSPKVENIIHTIGFVLLMALFVFISFNDILRLFGAK